MKLHRILAVTWRHMYSLRRNYDRLTDAIYWPVMDLIMWGLTTKWLATSGHLPSSLLLIMLTGIVFWQIVVRANQDICVSFLEETWSRNMINLFATSLTLSEWVAGVMLVGVLKIIMATVIGLGASWLLYSLNILEVGHLLLPFLVCLILFGWTLGLLASGLILGFGRQVQALAWTMAFLFAPLSAVYYPVSALPAILQPLAWTIPTTYVFEGMRIVLNQGAVSTQMLISSFVLNSVYLASATVFFVAMFERRRNKGLHMMEC
jgi:ABC-2 type transport system permease protein